MSVAKWTLAYSACKSCGVLSPCTYAGQDAKYVSQLYPHHNLEDRLNWEIIRIPRAADERHGFGSHPAKPRTATARHSSHAERETLKQPCKGPPPPPALQSSSRSWGRTMVYSPAGVNLLCCVMVISRVLPQIVGGTEGLLALPTGIALHVLRKENEEEEFG